MENLRRVNLLVGRNNIGKTSVLEAVYLLTSVGDPASIWRVLIRRGEQVTMTPTAGRPFQPEVEVGHLFHGHGLAVGKAVGISTFNHASDRSIRFEVGEATRDANPALVAQLDADPEGGLGARLSINVSGNPEPFVTSIPLTRRGGLRQDVLQAVANSAATKRGAAVTPNDSQYITTESLSIAEVQSAFNEISLSPREQVAMRALRFIEPDIERIALAPGAYFSGPGWPSRGGLKAKLKDMDEPVPIGSMGEGTWRMLALAIALTKSRNNVFLIDEIDIGLHFSMMQKLWSFVIETAMEFNIQVFATTHSLDCIRGLAALCRKNPNFLPQISIQRLGSRHATSYNESEIIALAEASRADDEIEVR